MAKTTKETVRDEFEDDLDNANPASVIEFSTDLNEQEAPVPLPEGDYEAEIRSVEIKESQRKTKYAEVTFLISPDQYPADFSEDGNPDGEILKYRRVSLEDNPRSRFNTRKFIEAIGAPLGKRIDLNQWIGCRANVTIGHDEYEGEMRANVTRVSAF